MIIDGFDLIHRRDTYFANVYLKPVTQLCTLDVTHLYTTLPKEESLNIPIEFFLQHDYHKAGVPIE
jgi:hypothetical protein